MRFGNEPARDSPTQGPLPKGDRNANPALPLFDLLAEDFRTHGSRLLAPGFWALAVHRFGNWRMGMPAIVRPPFTLTYRAAYRAVIALWGIDLPYNVKLGRRFRLDHHGCVHIGALAIGDDVVIRHTATIGLSRRTERTTAPTLGDRVEVGPGACIVGGINIGDDCYVGPNTVVAQSMAPHTTALGVPARIVSLAAVLADPPASRSKV